MSMPGLCVVVLCHAMIRYWVWEYLTAGDAMPPMAQTFVAGAGLFGILRVAFLPAICPVLTRHCSGWCFVGARRIGAIASDFVNGSFL